MGRLLFFIIIKNFRWYSNVAFSCFALHVLLKLKLFLFVQLMLRKNEWTQDEFLSRTNCSNNVDVILIAPFMLLTFDIHVFQRFVVVPYNASFCLHISNDTNRLTGTLSGYFFLIFSPSDRLFSKGCSSLYWNFMVAKGRVNLSQKHTEVSEM